MSERASTAIMPTFLRGCADEDIKVQPFVLRNVADEMERLQQRLDTVSHLLIQASGLLLYPHHQDQLIDCQTALRQALEAIGTTVVGGALNGSSSEGQQ